MHEPEGAPGVREAGWWPQVRAALVALHLAAVTLPAIPAPEGAGSRENWKDPTVQAELASWAEQFNRWGLAVTPDELEERLWRLAGDYLAVRDRVLAPFGPYYEFCGTGQSWRMFVAPHRYPTRLHIDIQEDGAWRPVYVERDPNHNWLGGQLDHHRFRSVIFRLGWPGWDDDLTEFSRWVAGRAARDFPRAERVRVHFHKYRTPAPEEVKARDAPKGEFVRPRVLPLEDFR
jgi:hypothetical protein